MGASGTNGAAAAANGLGHRLWVVPEGYLPKTSTGPEPEMTSHGTLCILNAGDVAAAVDIAVYFSDREPIAGYALRVEARRTLHARLNDLDDPCPLPRGVDFAVALRSSHPIIVQYTRLDSRQPANALMTAIAYAAG